MIYLENKLSEIENKPIYQYLLLAILTVVAAALRFYKLGEWSFWVDEMFTVSGKEDGFNYNILRQSISLTLIQATVAWLGLSEWSARLVPALFGLISIPILYFPVKKMFGRSVGFVTVLLLAVSPWHIYWSQNARFYVPLLLFYTLALLTFYFGIEEDRPWYLLISLILLGLATKERLLALFFIPIVLSYLALLLILPFEKPAGLRWRNLLLFFLPGLSLALFFAGPYVLNLSDWLSGFGWANNSPVRILAGVIYHVGLPTACMGVLGGGYLLTQKNRAALLLILGMFIPLLTIMGISTFHFTSSRYVFISLVSWIILAGLAASELLLQTQRKVKLLASGVLIFLLLTSLSEAMFYYEFHNGNRDNLKAAFELIRDQKQDGDQVAAINNDLGDYYLQEKTIGFGGVDPANIKDHETRVWFVEDDAAYGAFPHVHEWLEQNARLVANLDIHAQARTSRMRVYLYNPIQQLSDPNR